MKTVIITIEPPPDGGTQYPVHICRENGGDHGWAQQRLGTSSIPVDLTLPPAPDGAAQPVFTIESIRENFLDHPDDEEQRKRIGEFLFRLLISGEVEHVWEDLRNRYPREQAPHQGLQTFLVIKAHKLQSLPWELLRSPVKRLDLFLDPSNPFVRGGANLDIAGEAPSIPWPVHALMVIGSEEGDDDAKGEEEILAILDASREMGKIIDWEILFRPSRNRLREVYHDFKPRIFHFTGHGRVLGQQPVLELFSQSEDETWHWSIDDIIADLAGWVPSFAFINACRSGEMVLGESNWSITEAFRNLGVPTVIGMQADVTGKGAGIFSRHVYTALAQKQNLARALASARKEVNADHNHCRGARDWAAASLLLSTEPGQVLPVQMDIGRPEQDRIANCREFEKVRDFVNRVTDRRLLFNGLAPPAAAPGDSNLLVVRGDGDTGKTSLVLWCLECCMMKGGKILYVDAGLDKSLDFLDLLRLIRDGDPDSASLLTTPLEKQFFYAFNRDLNHLLSGQAPPPGPPDGPVEDQYLPLKVHDERTVSKIFNSFRQALAKASETTPVVIVLDHIEKIWKDHFTNSLLRRLLSPIARKHIPNLRMILAVTPDEYRSFDLHLHEELFQLITLEDFEPGDFLPLAREFFQCHKINFNLDVINEFLEAYQKFLIESDTRWKPKELRDFFLPRFKSHKNQG